MAFNYQKALQDGKSEDEILQYLVSTRSPNFKVDKALQDGKSKTDIIDYLANKNTGASVGRQTPTEEGPSLGDQVKSINLPNIAIGAAKGVGSTLLSMGQLGSKALESGYNATIGKLTNGKALSGSQAAEQAKNSKLLERKNLGQKIGFGGEQIGEFFVPVGVGAKAKLVSKVGQVAEKIPLIGKALPLTSKVATEGAEQYARTSVQEGDTNKNATVAGFLGAATPLLSKAGSIAGKLSNVLYSRTIPTTITEAARDVRKGLNIGGALSETGVSLSRKTLLSKVNSSISKLGNTLDSAIENSGSNGFKMSQLLKNTRQELESNFLAKAMKLSPVDVKSAENVIIGRLDEYKKLYGNKTLSLKEIQEIKVGLGNELEKVYKQALDVPIKAKALADMKVRQTLARTIEKAVPNAQSLNRSMAPLLEAQGRLMKKGAYSGYLTDVLAGGFAAGSVGDIISDPVGYMKKFATGVIVKRIGTSTAAKTITAQALKDIQKIAGSPQFYQILRELIEASGPVEPDMKAKE